MSHGNVGSTVGEKLLILKIREKLPMALPVHGAVFGGIAQFQANQEGERERDVSIFHDAPGHMPSFPGYSGREMTPVTLRGASPAVQM